MRSPTVQDKMDCLISQECVPELVDLKTKVFQQLDRLLTDTMVAASSSSCLGPSQFAGSMQRRDRVVVAHPVSGHVGGRGMVCVCVCVCVYVCV